MLRRAWQRAKDLWYIHQNSLFDLKLVSIEYREQILDPSLHRQLVLHCLATNESKPFALYLIASRCGARPQQIREVTAKHVDRTCTAWVFKSHKTIEKTKKPLVVYLHPCLQTLTKILLQSRSKNLFLNTQGNPWKKDTVVQRFERLRKQLDLPEGTVADVYRHTSATDALVAGLSTAVVAELLGHQDTRMVSTAYGHLHHQANLLQALSHMRKP